jgi:hypothetical protein
MRGKVTGRLSLPTARRKDTTLTGVQLSGTWYTETDPPPAEHPAEAHPWKRCTYALERNGSRSLMWEQLTVTCVGKRDETTTLRAECHFGTDTGLWSPTATGINAELAGIHGTSGKVTIHATCREPRGAAPKRATR